MNKRKNPDINNSTLTPHIEVSILFGAFKYTKHYRPADDQQTLVRPSVAAHSYQNGNTPNTADIVVSDDVVALHKAWVGDAYDNMAKRLIEEDPANTSLDQ